MSKIIKLLVLLLIVSLVFYKVSNQYLFSTSKKYTTGTVLLQPTEGEENEKLREQYEMLRHKTALGVSWKKIEMDNAKIAAQNKINKFTNNSLTDGPIAGAWVSKGAQNITGSLRAVDYVAATNTIYTVSNGGSLWSSTLGTGVWNLINKTYQFDPRSIKSFTKNGGGTRILISSGSNVFYSDDNGQTLTPSTGIIFPYNWGGNYVAGFYKLNDAQNTIYCLVRLYSDVPFAPRFRLYISTNQGISYSQINQFDVGDDNNISACIPYNSNTLYIADVASSPGNTKLYSVTGSTINLISTSAISAGNTKCMLKGTTLGGTTYLYIMLNDSKIYASTNLGTNWAIKPPMPEVAYGSMNVSINDANRLSFGGVNAYRLSTDGLSFIQVNDWSEYYGNISAKLHADIMSIEYFKKSDNTEFSLINTHGGTYISYDNLQTVNNMSLSGHVAVEYYDVITDTLRPNRIFAGSQDQGLQGTLTGSNVGVQNFKQILSGDYGQLCLTNNNDYLWAQYPRGRYFVYYNLGNANPFYIIDWTMPGTQKPNSDWMLAGTATADINGKDIWAGGGNLTGGGGSYLIKLSLQQAPGPSFNLTSSQFNYDFRANSNNGTSGISAIEQSLINTSKLFVATEDGTFFYSNNAGVSWNKTATFNGPTPWYLYGSCILASKKDANLIWYTGSGYSNPGVYKSTDGGVSFSPMATGLPNTLVNEIVANSDESLIFAATEAGPYVYVVADSKWYTIADITTPTQFFSGVEYLRAENTVRFSTNGMGIWDFKVAAPLPIKLNNWAVKKQANKVVCSWQTEQELNTANFEIERSVDGINFTSIGSIAAKGNSSSTNSYSFLDQFPINGINYYRLKTLDVDTKFSLSSVIPIKIEQKTFSLNAYPNPVKNVLNLQINSNLQTDAILTITDLSGRIVQQENRIMGLGTSTFNLKVDNLIKGTYFITVKSKAGNQQLKLIKL
jgi:Secretion system C-terminal sorting domain